MIKYSIDETVKARNEIMQIQSEILMLLSDIKKLYLSLDEKVWNNKEKKKLDVVFTKFLDVKTNNLNNKFTANLTLLDLSIKRYGESIETIKKYVGDRK